MNAQASSGRSHAAQAQRVYAQSPPGRLALRPAAMPPCARAAAAGAQAPNANRRAGCPYYRIVAPHNGLPVLPRHIVAPHGKAGTTLQGRPHITSWLQIRSRLRRTLTTDADTELDTLAEEDSEALTLADTEPDAVTLPVTEAVTDALCTQTPCRHGEGRGSGRGRGRVGRHRGKGIKGRHHRKR